MKMYLKGSMFLFIAERSIGVRHVFCSPHFKSKLTEHLLLYLARKLSKQF